MHPLTPPVSIMSLASSVPVFDHFELSGYNLATHTSALGQNVLGKPDFLASNGLVVPATICGKRSRSNSEASSFDCSSDASSTYNSSVFLSDRDGDRDATESSCVTPSTVDHASLSRKSSAGQDSEQQLDNLATWRASILSEHTSEPSAKRFKALHSDAADRAAEDEGVTSLDVATQHSLSGDSVTSAPSIPTSESASDRSSSPASSTSSECKNTFVDCLVVTACQTLDRIWKASASSSVCDLGESKTGLPLQVFVRETLRRGRATCSVLQAALLYCARLGEAMNELQYPLVGPTSDVSADTAMLGLAKEDLYFLRCPRRMFLASILISSKFLQDRTYSNRAWAKLSGLNVKDLGRIERAFLKAIDYRLVVSDKEWDDWNAELKRTRLSAASNTTPTLSSGLCRSQSDNVTGAAAPYDTELRAVSPRAMSQVAHKYRAVAPSSSQ